MQINGISRLFLSMIMKPDQIYIDNNGCKFLLWIMVLALFPVSVIGETSETTAISDIDLFSSTDNNILAIDDTESSSHDGTMIVALTFGLAACCIITLCIIFKCQSKRIKTIMEIQESMDKLDIQASGIPVKVNVAIPNELVNPPIDETNSTESTMTFAEDFISEMNHSSIPENPSSNIKVMDVMVNNEPIEIQIEETKMKKRDNNSTTSIESILNMKKVELSICYEEKSQHVSSTEITTNTPCDDSISDSNSTDHSIEEMYNHSDRRSTYSSTIGNVSIGESKSGNDDNKGNIRDKNFNIEVIESKEGYDREGTNVYWE